MSSKRGSKSSKTARVLSLLTDPAPDQEGGKEQGLHSEAAPVPVNDIRVSDEHAEAEIRSALEEELLAELGTPPETNGPESAVDLPEFGEDELEADLDSEASEPEASVEPEPEPEAETAPVEESEPEPVEEAAVEPEPEPVAGIVEEIKPEEAPEQASGGGTAMRPDEGAKDSRSTHKYINIMEMLVESKVDEYMQHFKMCTCERCRMDVIALSLTRMSAKYVVGREHELIPRLSVYESRYSAEISTQVMSACSIVRDNPHHDR